MKLVNGLAIALVALYVALFFAYNPTPLFNSVYAGQDARQQLFPLYSFLYPEIFEGDLIYESMRAYLGPLHLFLARVIIGFTESPILTGFYIMAIQLALIVVFLFLAVRKFSSTFAGCAAVAWFIHTPWLVRNTFGGLPRGWSGAILASFLYFLAVRNHLAIIGVLFLGALLHPHSTFLAALCYGLFLSYEVFRAAAEPSALRALKRYVLLAPLLVGVTFLAVSRTPEIGTMVTLEQAREMPAFSQKGGRFPFVPLDDPASEFKRASLRVFFSFEGKVTRAARDAVAWGIGIFFVAVLLAGPLVRRKLLPDELTVFAVSIASAYFLARLFAFRLYVPIRYLAWPPSLFFLISIPVVIWRICEPRESGRERARVPWLAIATLAAGVGALFYTGGTSLGGRTNYREGRHFEDPFYRFIREQTPRRALFAGHPTYIDGMQLYGIRRAYVTTETAHPFFDRYNDEMERRLRITFEALYARDERRFLELVEQEGIDYFVFPAKYFRQAADPPPTFEHARYFLPHDRYVKELADYPAEEFLYFRLMSKEGSKPYVVYRSKEVLIIDTHLLRAAIGPGSS